MDVPPYKDQRPVYFWGGRRSGKVYLGEHAEIIRLVNYYMRKEKQNDGRRAY